MITTLHDNDSGVCALANLAGVSYDETLDAIFGGKHKWTYGTQTADLKWGAKNLGLATATKRLVMVTSGGWSSVPDMSIVKVSLASKNVWHWVSKRGGMVYDGNNAAPVECSEYGSEPVSFVQMVK